MREGVMRAGLIGLAVLGATPALAQTGGTPAMVTTPAITARPDGLELREGDRLLRVTALTDSVLRVRVGRAGVLPEDASWAVAPAVRDRHVAVRAAPDGFSTAALRVRAWSAAPRGWWWRTRVGR